MTINPDYYTSNQDSKIRRISTLRDGANADLTAYQYMSYDENGNLTDDGENYEFLYDVFNRLVQVKKNTGAKPVVAKYTYNALGQRISEQYDCNNSGNTGATDGVTDTNDPTFFIAVDRAGRRVATYRGTDSSPKETFVYHAAGLAHNGQQPDGVGPSFSGGVALRDRDGQNSDPTKWATTSASDRTERYEYCADARGSVMALVSASGALIEQYRYSPTGVPNGLPLGDLDTDGEVKSATGQADDLLVKNTTYQVRKDLNLDGARDSADETIVTNQNGKKTGRGKLSRESVGNRKSFLGLESEVGREWVQSAGEIVSTLLPISRHFGSVLDERRMQHSTAWDLGPVRLRTAQRTLGTPVDPATGQPSDNASDQVCCDNYEQQDVLSLANTICCNGRFLICLWSVWVPREIFPQPHTCSADRAIQDCIVEHEQRHVQNRVALLACRQDVPENTPTNPRPIPGMHPDCEHCFIYELQEQCLYAKLAACPVAAERAKIEKELARVARRRAESCGDCLGGSQRRVPGILHDS